jgi:hypothetical protein
MSDTARGRQMREKMLQGPTKKTCELKKAIGHPKREEYERVGLEYAFPM